MKRFVTALLAGVFLLCSAAWTGTAELSGDEENPALAEKVRAVVAEVVRPGMTEKQKAKALHDWLIYHAYYDTTILDEVESWGTEDFVHGHSAEGVLLYGKGVCESYAKAYDLLLKEAGMEDEIIIGYVYAPQNIFSPYESHAWNLVRIDGAWYQVDVTHDDPSGATVPRSGSENWKYFMADNDTILKQRLPDEKTVKMLVDRMGTGILNSLPEGAGMPKTKAFPKLNIELPDGTRTTVNDFGAGKPMLIFLAGDEDIPYVWQNLGKADRKKIKWYNLSVLIILDFTVSGERMRQLQAENPEVEIAKLTSMFDGFNAGYDLFRAYGTSTNSVSFPVTILKNRENKIAYLMAGWGIGNMPISRMVSSALLMTDGPVGEEPEDDGKDDDEWEEPYDEWEDPDGEEPYNPWPDDVDRTPGDVNTDGTVDGRDVIVLMKYLAGDMEVENEGRFAFCNADVNGTQTVNEKDLLRLMRYLAKENVVLK